jgi:hypothetical protein
MYMTNLFDLQPVDPKEMTVDQIKRFEILESGWMSFWEQASRRVHDTAELKAKDGFYAGAALVITILSVLAEDEVRDHVRRMLCGKLDEEIARFNETANYSVKFTPFVRELK